MTIDQYILIASAGLLIAAYVLLDVRNDRGVK